MVVEQRIRNQLDPAADSVDKLSEALDRLSDGQLVGLLSSMLDRRPTMSAVRNEVVSLLASANTVTGLRNAYLVHYALNRGQVPQVLQDAQIEASARENVLKDGVLSALEVAELIGVKNTSPRAWASRLRVSESGWLPEGQTPAAAAAQGGHDELLERMARPAGQY